MKCPSRLYKYRSFDSFTLAMLCNREVYYSPPSAFNDPLDCKPSLVPDLETPDLLRLAAHICDTDVGRLGEHPRFKYWESYYKDPGWDAARLPLPERTLREVLHGVISDWLKKFFETTGVLCMATSWDSALMWSHYADSHRGLCVEFAGSDNACEDLRRVRYDAPRGISAADIAHWKFRRDEAAKERVRDAFLAVKAPGWTYENEWRDIKKAGVHRSPWDVSAIYFGLRCPEHVITSLIKLSDSLPKIKYYQVRVPLGGFALDRMEIDPRELRRWPYLPSFRVYGDARELLEEKEA